MSLHPEDIPPVPETTAATARAAFPHGNRYMAMRDELGVFYTDQDFAALFPTRGQPAETPWRLALILVFQFAEGFSDEQAADAVRSRIDWKYALSLDLTDPGFDASVLSEFRTRLVQGGAEMHLLDAMLARFKAVGLLKARGRQRTDSTHVLAAVRALNRLECVGETVRQALNALAIAAPDWLRPRLHPDWIDRYGTRFDDYRLPKAEAARQALAEQIGADGRVLLRAISAADAPTWLHNLRAVCILRQVWIQHYYAVGDHEPMRWRAWADLPAAAQMITTPYDIEARYSIKRTTVWTGYKVHLSESCADDTPHLITHVETTPATTPDWHAPAIIHGALAHKELLAAEHLLDAGYVDTDTLVSSRSDHQIEVIGPVPPDTSWQARAGLGFDIACFRVDWEAKQVQCPQGRTSRKWSETHDRHGSPIINIRFARTDCQACRQHANCTTSDGPREMTFRPKELHTALQAARDYQRTAEFKARYKARAGVEGSLSEGLRACGLRRARYIGLAKTRLQHILTAAGLNLRRVGAWFAETPRTHTRIAPFVALAGAGP
jgi:transposase